MMMIMAAGPVPIATAPASESKPAPVRPRQSGIAPVSALAALPTCAAFPRGQTRTATEVIAPANATAKSAVATFEAAKASS